MIQQQEHLILHQPVCFQLLPERHLIKKGEKVKIEQVFISSHLAPSFTVKFFSFVPRENLSASVRGVIQDKGLVNV